MKRNNDKISTILCILLVAFALLAPALIETQVKRDRYGEWVQPTTPVWQGQLSLWTVVGFPVGQNTLGGWVRERVRAFEKDAFGVYVDVRVMEWEEAKAAFAAGETPDVIVFPAGFFDSPDALEPIGVPEGLNEALADSAKRGGTAYALPVMAGAYVLAVNEELGMAAGVTPPEDIGYSPSQVAEMVGAMGGSLCVDQTGYSNPAFAFAYALAEGEEAAVQALSKAKGAAAFYSGNGLLCLGNQNTAAKARSDYENGEGFGSSVWALSGFTDMVEYVGVVKGRTGAKAQICEQLAGSFLAGEAQQSVKDLGMFPALEGGEPLYEDDGRFWAAEQAFDRETAVPPCFGYAGVRARWAEWLEEAAKGDAGALQSLLGNMRAACKQG